MEIISNCTQDDITKAAKALKDGHLVAFPTETVYGLGADATNEKAVSRIYSVKGRPTDHPLIVHISAINRLEDWATDIPDYAIKLAREFWPGPMTLILPRKVIAKDFITGGQNNVGLRVPDQLIALTLLKKFEEMGGQGVAAPSANLFGRVSPTTAAHVREAFPDLLVLDGGACDIGIESTIVDCSRGFPMLMRPGMLSQSQLSAACGVQVLSAASHLADPGPQTSPASPGTLVSHYAPRARLRLLSAEQMASRLPTAGDSLAVWARSSLAIPSGVRCLSMPTDAAACAHDLFAQLRAMDELGVQEIWVETPPLGEAWDGVRDRLQRASTA